MPSLPINVYNLFTSIDSPQLYRIPIFRIHKYKTYSFRFDTLCALPAPKQKRTNEHHFRIKEKRANSLKLTIPTMASTTTANTNNFMVVFFRFNVVAVFDYRTIALDFDVPKRNGFMC